MQIRERCKLEKYYTSQGFHSTCGGTPFLFVKGNVVVVCHGAKVSGLSQIIAEMTVPWGEGCGGQHRCREPVRWGLGWHEVQEVK